MFAQAPAFWWHEAPTCAARILAPAGALYGEITARRMARSGHRAGVPVVCIGNFVAGGAGKTPTALAIARLLAARGASPAFLSRGYGRQHATSGVLRVDPARHSADTAGDEPLLLARIAPTFVARDRAAAAEAAIAAGASILLLDDGLQNPNLTKDASIVVVDGRSGVGNGLCVPAGPLRAPLDRQWPAASLLCVLGDGEAGSNLASAAGCRGIPVVGARLDVDAAALAGLQGRRLVAFSGIGRPEKFFRTLDELGLAVAAHHGFPDHHRFDGDVRRGLLEEARLLGADLITTEKDRVRLPSDFRTQVLPITLRFDDVAAIEALLERAISGPTAFRA